MSSPRRALERRLTRILSSRASSWAEGPSPGSLRTRCPPVPSGVAAEEASGRALDEGVSEYCRGASCKGGGFGALEEGRAWGNGGRGRGLAWMDGGEEAGAGAGAGGGRW